jgi:hypothetical protein
VGTCVAHVWQLSHLPIVFIIALTLETKGHLRSKSVSVILGLKKTRRVFQETGNQSDLWNFVLANLTAVQ